MDENGATLFIVAAAVDFVIDEMSQNDVTATAIKNRFRKLIKHLLEQEQNGAVAAPARQLAGKRDRPASGELPETTARDKKRKANAEAAPKAARKTHAHQVFLTYGSKCVPSKWLNKFALTVPQGRVMNMVQSFRRTLPKATFEKFQADVQPIVAELNGDPARKSGDNTKLVAWLKAADKEADREVHPIFAGMFEFITEYGKTMKEEREAAVDAAGPSDQAAAKGRAIDKAERKAAGGKAQGKASTVAAKKPKKAKLNKIIPSDDDAPQEDQGDEVSIGGWVSSDATVNNAAAAQKPAEKKKASKRDEAGKKTSEKKKTSKRAEAEVAVADEDASEVEAEQPAKAKRGAQKAAVAAKAAALQGSVSTSACNRSEDDEGDEEEVVANNKEVAADAEDGSSSEDDDEEEVDDTDVKVVASGVNGGSDVDMDSDSSDDSDTSSDEE